MSALEVGQCFNAARNIWNVKRDKVVDFPNSAKFCQCVMSVLYAVLLCALAQVGRNKLR